VLYRAAGVDPKQEQHWLTFTLAMLLFHIGTRKCGRVGDAEGAATS
jgi:K+-transporting ATPase A subunit